MTDQVVPRFKATPPLAKRRKGVKPVSDKRRAQWAAEDEVRQAVFARDRWRCQLERVDGAGPCLGRLTFQHRLKASQGGKFTMENGATLCWSHNERLEQDADLARLGVELGLVIRRG